MCILSKNPTGSFTKYLEESENYPIDLFLFFLILSMSHEKMNLGCVI